MAAGAKRGHLGLYLSLSLLFHLNIALVVIAGMSMNPDGCAPADTQLPIEVTLVPSSKDPKEVKPEEFAKADKEEEKKELDDQGQVVDLPPPREEKRPDKARFRSEYDSKVERETKGRPVPFKEGKLLANRPVKIARDASPDPQKQRRVARKVMKLAMRTQPEIPRSEFDRDQQGEEPQRAEQRKQEQGPAQGPVVPGAQKRRLTMKDLQLSDEELARAIGTRVNDALENVEEGDRTLLNSKRWRFASFFNRVKRQVAQNWHPDRAYRRRDPSGNVYGFRDRLTILRVQLTPSGKLEGVQVEKACGVGFLDDEAIAAFRAAEPFPNPPKGLVKDGKISFRFGFLFEISRRPSFRVFRFRN